MITEQAFKSTTFCCPGFKLTVQPKGRTGLVAVCTVVDGRIVFPGGAVYYANGECYAINCCPWCGTQLVHPTDAEEDLEQSQQRA